jgi:propionyl-CoA synthetase
LYTSGTTGKPKGVVRDTGGYAFALKFSMQKIYNIKEAMFFWASDVGWVVGHSFIVYGPLINRNSSIILKGNQKHRCQYFWRIIDEHKVNAMFTAPTAIRAIRKEDPNGDFIKQYDLSSLKTIFSRRTL